MPAIQKIICEVNCPRCNAIAQERYVDREDKYVILILWCDKCKLRRNLGITTRKALKLRKRQLKLRQALSEAKSPTIRSRMEKELILLEQKINKAELGIH